VIRVRVNDEELDVIERVKKAMSYETISEAIRSIFAFADVFFDERLTVEKAVKPYLLKTLFKENEILKTMPISDILKPVAKLKEELKR